MKIFKIKIPNLKELLNYDLFFSAILLNASSYFGTKGLFIIGFLPQLMIKSSKYVSILLTTFILPYSFTKMKVSAFDLLLGSILSISIVGF